MTTTTQYLPGLLDPTTAKLSSFLPTIKRHSRGSQDLITFLLMINAYDKNINDDDDSSVVYETIKKLFPFHNLSINKLKALLVRENKEHQTVGDSTGRGLNMTEFLKDIQVLNEKNINLVI